MRNGRGSRTPPTSKSRCSLIVPTLYSPPREACHAYRPASTAEVCYLGLSDQGKRTMALEEVARRGDSCEKHKDEIARMHERNRRASGVGMGGGVGVQPSG